MITAKLIQVDSPTRSGTIYPKDTVEKAIKNFREGTKQDGFPIFKKPCHFPMEDDVIGWVENARVENGFLIGEVGFLQDKVGHLSEGEHICVLPNGAGTVKEGIVQDDYIIIGFFLSRSPNL